MANYSKQREAILNELRGRCDHPTASQVYEGVREVIPNISLGTVYRNLASLVESGEILSVTVGDGKEHFDGDKSFHLHLHCKCCGAIIDSRVKDDKLNSIAKFDGFAPETSVCVVYGLCKNCQKQ
ncbi:MAG: transcriptional repressor [Ruminococcaceae bacterium]|nr:transcriptional repressor [Oscillospiraceae bacterium]